MRQKGKFLTFCCSLFPGAGHMYLGFMKMGISLMVLFWGVIALGVLMNLGVLYFTLPIIWCYSFFDAVNKNSMDEEEFYLLEDDYLFHMDPATISAVLSGKNRTAAALILIIVGAAMLLSNFMGFLNEILPWQLYWGLENFLRYIPRICIALFIIWIGMQLIQGKRLELHGQSKEKIFIRTQLYSSDQEGAQTGQSRREDWTGTAVNGEKETNHTDQGQGSDGGA